MTATGDVKLLDFGLARMFEPESGEFNSLPTSPTLMTMDGVVLGTVPYMSPEQTRGKGVDKRSDIWAFGCVLFEMLTGQQAFGGETMSDIIAGILSRELDMTAFPVITPPESVTLSGSVSKRTRARGFTTSPTPELRSRK